MDGIHSAVAGPVSATQRLNALPPRLLKAAHEFEAQMMKELLKPMTAGGSFTEDDEDSGSSEIMGGFAAEALGRSLSERGGFGIANSILQSLSQKGENLRNDASLRVVQGNST
jgi:Rod binding domain-containing protein